MRPPAATALTPCPCVQPSTQKSAALRTCHSRPAKCAPLKNFLSASPAWRRTWASRHSRGTWGIPATWYPIPYCRWGRRSAPARCSGPPSLARPQTTAAGPRVGGELSSAEVAVVGREGIMQHGQVGSYPASAVSEEACRMGARGGFGGMQRWATSGESQAHGGRRADLQEFTTAPAGMQLGVERRAARSGGGLATGGSLSSAHGRRFRSCPKTAKSADSALVSSLCGLAACPSSARHTLRPCTPRPPLQPAPLQLGEGPLCHPTLRCGTPARLLPGPGWSTPGN